MHQAGRRILSERRAARGRKRVEGTKRRPAKKEKLAPRGGKVNNRVPKTIRIVLEEKQREEWGTGSSKGRLARGTVPRARCLAVGAGSKAKKSRASAQPPKKKKKITKNEKISETRRQS